ncbi:MAG: hypothetical protein ACTHJT_12080 [Cytophaga sp.]|uniref:hypothetical protein n=1 Tax=Cytophaga sp. TaxID=29535 RepID=UPI003F80B500
MNRTIGMRQVYEYPVVFSKPQAPDLTKILSVPVQTFYLESNADTIFYGKEGTILFIRPACLTLSDSAATGKIEFELKELYSKKALLKERAYTVSNGSVLESDGSVYINAFSENGAPLYIACEDAVKIRLPKDIQTNMTYFEGVRNEDGNMNWNLSENINSIYEESYTESFIAEDDAYKETQIQKSLNTYFFSIKNFGWINCDRFYEDSLEKASFVATFLVPVPEKKFTEVYNYIVFDSLMSVIPLYKDNSGQWVCPDLPVGAPVTCISIQKTDTHLYYGIAKTRVGDRESFIIQLNAINEQELQKQLDLSL